MAVLPNQKAVKNYKPKFNAIAELGNQGLIITARGETVDFVSRYFAPNAGINEDPVTGSNHSVLTPFWAKQLNKNKLKAKQLSERGGDIFCELKEGRVLISGNAVTYMQGEVEIEAKG